MLSFLIGAFWVVFATVASACLLMLAVLRLGLLDL